MDAYEAELAAARRRIAELGRNPDEFSFSMSPLPPDPDGGGMYTVEYEVGVQNNTTAKSMSATGGIGWDWVSAVTGAIEKGRLD